MRGQVLHNHIASEIKAVCDRLSIRSKLEYPVCTDKAKVYFDVAAWINGSFMACEVETTIRRVIHNVEKAHMAGAELWLVVPTRKLKRQIANKLRKIETKPSGKEIKLLLLEEVSSELMNKLSLSIPANSVVG